MTANTEWNRHSVEGMAEMLLTYRHAIGWFAGFERHGEQFEDLEHVYETEADALVAAYRNCHTLQLAA